MTDPETVTVIHEADRVVDRVDTIVARLRGPGCSSRDLRIADELADIVKPLSRALSEQERVGR